MQSKETKTAQLQVRVSPAQKRRIKQAAKQAGQDVSSWVLERLLPPEHELFSALVRQLTTDAEQQRYTLAALNDLLASLPPSQLAAAVAVFEPFSLAPLPANLVAAMVEQACLRAGLSPPAWTAAIAPLEQPYFATSLLGLRLHLLSKAAAAYKRRNIFVDAGVGERL